MNAGLWVVVGHLASIAQQAQVARRTADTANWSLIPGPNPGANGEPWV